MRRMSAERRRVVSLAGSVAAMSGVGPVLLKGHHWLALAWSGLMAVLLVWVIARLMRLQHSEGCK